MKDLMNKIHNHDMKDLIKKVDSNSISCIFTDVPYEISKGGSTKVEGAMSWNYISEKRNGKIFEHNNIKPEEYLADFYRILEETGHIYLMTNSIHLAEIQKQMEKVGFIINNILVMVKNNTVTNQHYMKNCEFTIFARKGASKGLNDFGINSAICVDMPRGENKIHDTQKPLQYVKKLIGNSTKKGDIVADFFSGSGVVANACIDLGVDYICCEIDEAYHKRSTERIQKATGNVGLFA
jgi:DNA modification methylase